MCGIAGIVSSHHSPLPILVKDMAYSLHHRGPDDQGVFYDEHVGFAHTRLSIVDTSFNGHQPMMSADGRLVLIFNGEIYNHTDIRRDLLAKGYSFQSGSDTETLLYGYHAYGKEILNNLNGIFAFAIYDKQAGRVLVARDQFGVKPLYFSELSPGEIIFASEIKTLLGHPSLNKAIDHTALLSYINFLWSPGTATPFKHIHKLLPGHYIDIDVHARKSHSPQRYYQIPMNGQYSNLTEDELLFKLDLKLNRAVERQLMSDVPVGFFLSGGIDSSIVATLAARLQPGKTINCYTIANTGRLESEGFGDDLYFARKLSKQYGFNLVEVPVESNIVDDFDQMIWYLDEPQADPAPLNVLRIAQYAKEDKIKVLLGGTAGDDIFSGYRRHQALQYEKYLNLIPSSAQQWLQRKSMQLDVQKPLQRRLKKFLQYSGQNANDRLINYFYWIDKEMSKGLFSKNIQDELSSYSSSTYMHQLLKQIPEEKSRLNQLLYLEMNSFLVDHNLNYTDKMSMAAGVEARVPFLDKELVEFSTEIPPHLKMKGTTTKYLLREVSKKYLPKEIINRSKAGFGAPVRQWITNELNDMVEERLSEKSLRERGIFDVTTVRKMIADNKAGKIDASYTIWSLMAIESWMKQFVDHNYVKNELREVSSIQY